MNSLSTTHSITGTVLVTGVAGFIGSHLARKLLSLSNIKVIGIDSLNPYYEPKLKLDRLRELDSLNTGRDSFIFREVDISKTEDLRAVFKEFQPDFVINLAAQAGVRYSIENPQAYVDSNLAGFFNILEECRRISVKHLLFASSSSVYGDSNETPYSVNDSTDYPVSFYAATKKANEVMAHSYSHLYGIPTTGLRFFTVYGPFGRPDMAYFSFTKKILEGKTISLFNNGQMLRDFTYIDDIIEAITRLISIRPDVDDSKAPFALHNIGNHSPVALLDFVHTLEQSLLRVKLQFPELKTELLPMQPGDVQQTFADISSLEKAVGFRPSTSLSDGLFEFASWYKSYYLQ